jgi:3-oxoadipate enol-lactonase / 4-carboxymuconolactone decarboxylase
VKPPRLAAPRQRMRLSGCELAYREDGPPGAPVLVLSNSLGTALEMWGPQVASLCGRFRVVRYDQRGHGESSAPPGPYSIEALGLDVLELLDGLGCERASIAGISLGGMVGMWLASHHPGRVERLVLACTAPYLGPAGAWTERAAHVRRHGTGSLAGVLFERWFTPRLRETEPELLWVFRTMLESCSDDGYASCCEAIASMDQREAVGSITAPTLVIAGADDPVAPPARGLELQQAIAGASLVVLARAAHIANVARPSEFSEAMLAHLAGVVFERGLAERRAVLGDGYVDATLALAMSSGSLAVEAFQQLITSFAWGSVWARPTIDRRTRRMLTLALLAGLGRLGEFELHAGAAIEDRTESGVGAEAIRELLLHVAVYAGVPAANAALPILERLESGD